jgi:hypothetical protein
VKIYDTSRSSKRPRSPSLPLEPFFYFEHCSAERFVKLRRFFHVVERVTSLETALSSPATSGTGPSSGGEMITRRMNEMETARRELQCLLEELEASERENGFLFRPRSSNAWTFRACGDSCLRGIDGWVHRRMLVFEHDLV